MEAWERAKNIINRNARIIVGINNGTEPYHKVAFVNSIYNKIATYANHGDIETVNKAIELVREINKTHVIVTERHKFFKLSEIALKNQIKAEEAAEKQNEEFKFSVGIVIKNFSADRLQIKFDEKPKQEIIDELKRSAFRWSRAGGVWQRKLIF